MEQELIEAAGKSDVNKVKLLLKEGADPSFDNNQAIRWASQYGHTEVVKLLLEDSRVDPGDVNNEAIRMASRYNHVDIVNLLLQDGRVDPAADNNDAILWASRNGHTEVVKLFLQDPRVDPTANNNYPIRVASSYGHTEVVKLLLEDKRVDPVAGNNYAIRVASLNGHLEVVRLLLQDPRVDPSDDNNYAIGWSSDFGHTEVVKLLMKDPRVDWRYAPYSIKQNLIKTEQNKLKEELVNTYLSIERSVPKTDFGNLPKDLIEQTSYLAPYQELCSKISNSEIPPIKLIALANILKIKYNESIKWTDLCDNVKKAIYKSMILY